MYDQLVKDVVITSSEGSVGRQINNIESNPPIIMTIAKHRYAARQVAQGPWSSWG